MNIETHTAWALALLICNPVAFAADEAGIVKTSRGQVVLERAGQKLDAPVGARIFASDRVVTGADGSVGITLRDNTILSAGPNSSAPFPRHSPGGSPPSV